MSEDSVIIAKKKETGALEILRLSPLESKALHSLAASGSLEVASTTGISEERLKEMLEDGAIRSFVEGLQKRLLEASMVTEERVDSILHRGLAKVEERVDETGLNKNDISLLNAVMDRKGLKKQKVELEIHSNPYAKMSNEQIDAEYKERLEFEARRKIAEQPPGPSTP